MLLTLLLYAECWWLCCFDLDLQSTLISLSASWSSAGKKQQPMGEFHWCRLLRLFFALLTSESENRS